MNAHDVDLWAASIREAGNAPCTCTEEFIDIFEPSLYPFQSAEANRFVRIESPGQDPFYCYFQPCFQKQAPLIVHTPGYCGEMSMHPELAQYFHVLHVNPLGYTTPDGKDCSKMTMDGKGTVFPDTLRTGGRGGYYNWLVNCVMAVNWALGREDVLKDRVSFFGTSQGGGAALLLGSIFCDITRATASEEPFLTNLAMAAGRGAYGMGRELYADADPEDVRRGAYLIDTVHHVHRFRFPVLLTSGGRDDTCPPETVADLFARLPGTKSYTHFADMAHGYHREFIQLVKAWFLTYA